MRVVNVVQLTEHLSRNPDAVITVLEEIGFTNLVHNRAKNSVRFARQEGRNPSSVVLDLSTLSYKCFSTNERGNLYSLIMAKKALSFPDSLHFVTSLLGLTRQQFTAKISLPFGGFFKGLVREIAEPELTMPTYDESILEEYLHKYNLMFFHDGISFQTQEKFKIGYDLHSGRITIPIYTLDNKLCGVMGRLNDKDCPKEDRYFPLIVCSRSSTLYGYGMNYAAIQQKGLCVVTEAEKGVMQMDSFGCHIGLSTSGHYVSPVQERYIKSLMLPRVILAYDEGLEEDQIREEAQKLAIDNQIIQTRVGYVFDRENQILKKDSKNSPTDLGRDRFTELIKNHVVWIKE